MSKIIPVFVPHAGCPHQCVFCNQKTISGQKETSVSEARQQIENYLVWIKSSKENEIAFYGGSFTAIDLQLQENLLRLANTYRERNLISSIRLSTRPDCIYPENLAMLKKYNVSLVELGVQSLDNEVLNLAERGHSPSDVYKAVSLLKAEGLKVGIQLMVGLAGQSWKSIYQTVREVIELAPDVVRIYPVLVIKGTKLAEQYQQGVYRPLTLEEAIMQSAYVYEQMEKNKIKVIRVGLQADGELCTEGNILAGPFHPAFGELVASFRYRQWIGQQLEACSKNNLRIALKYNPRLTSKIRGLKKVNVHSWKKLQSNFNFEFKETDIQEAGLELLTIEK